jgi:hypothetical protein
VKGLRDDDALFSLEFTRSRLLGSQNSQEFWCAIGKSPFAVLGSAGVQADGALDKVHLPPFQRDDLA